MENKETAIASENAKQGKTRKYILGWKEQNKTADKSDNTRWREKSKDIVERRETEKIAGLCQAVQRKWDILK